MELSNERMDQISSARYLYVTLKANARALASRSTANAQLLIYSAVVVSCLIDRMMEIDLEVDRFAEGIRALIKGDLSPTLMVISDLQDKLGGGISDFTRLKRTHNITTMAPRYTISTPLMTHYTLP